MTELDVEGPVKLAESKLGPDLTAVTLVELQSPEPHSPPEESIDARSGSSPPESKEDDVSRPGENILHGTRIHHEDEENMDCETGSLDDLEDDDQVISFAAPSPPLIAKPIIIAQGNDPTNALNTEKPGANRLRTLSMNGHLTLNLAPQQMVNPSSPSRDGSSSPTMGRFKVTTCPQTSAFESAQSRSPPQNTQLNPNPVVSPTDPEPPQPVPQAKDERLMTPIERLQLYIDTPNLPCRSGVAVQYVNFIRDSDDPETFINSTARLFDRLIQDQEVSVRTAFLENIPQIVRSYKPSFKKLRLMSFLGDSIRDENYNVRRLAQVAIGQLIEFAPELMTRETITASVVPLLIQIFYAESTADLMIDALNLFSKLLDKVGPDPVRRLFIPEFSKLCVNDIAQIRQVCAQNLVFVVRYFAVTQAEEFFETDDHCKLIQDRIIQLSQDYAWHVRETVASVFPQLIDICHKRWPTFTTFKLYPAFTVLLNDQAKQVRRWATRGLGRIIATSQEPGKTRLHLTSNGTVEFAPPTSYRFSDSDLMEMDMRRGAASSPALSEGNERRSGGRMRGIPGAVSSPAGFTHVDHARRNFYNRLGIPTSLNHALNEEVGASLGKGKAEERPDFNCFRFWQNPIPEVAVTEKEGTPVIVPVAVAEEKVGGTLVAASVSRLQEMTLEEGSLSDVEDVAVEIVSELTVVADMEVEELPPSIEVKVESVDGKVEEKSGDKIISPDSDDTRSVSSASSNSQDQTTTTFIVAATPASFSTSYEIDPFIIEKHKRRDRAVMIQLQDSGEIAGKLEDILPNILFLREFLLLAKDNDRDTVTQVAVDFPAVALTIGRQFWPEIQECHRILATHNVMQARELMAASLPRIAEIIGYYHTVVDLVPLVNEFLKDTDSVRINMIENYSAFIMRMPPEIRPIHLLRLCEFFTPDEERNWRYRYACAEQIAHLALLFPPKLVVRNLMDGAWFFARDKTAEVRKNSTVALSSIFMRIEQQRDQHSRNLFLQKLDLFLRNEDFRSRQVFAQFCEDLLSKAALSFDAFSLYFGDRFWPLFDHPVVAIRLAAARCLVYIPPSGRQTLFGKAVENLKKDPSQTIQEIYLRIIGAGNAAVAPGQSAAGN